MSEAVKLAKGVLSREAICMVGTFQGVVVCMDKLANAVIAQDEELVKLRAALAEAIEYLEREGFDETVERLRRLL